MGIFTPDPSTTHSWSGWVGTESVRGTSDIISSCLVTLSLCSWTALHLNVDLTKSITLKFIRHVLLMLVAVLFPEFILFKALEQYRAARELRKNLNSAQNGSHSTTNGALVDDHGAETIQNTSTAINNTLGSVGARGQTTDPADLEKGPWPAVSKKLPLVASKELGEQKEDISKTLNPDWTMKQAYWVIAGGLAVRTWDKKSASSVTLTAAGVEELVKAGLLAPIPEEEIDGRGRSDGIAKFVVCIQALWFLVQLIARAVCHLPIALLELHTAANATLALVMYLLWFSKTYMPDLPIYLEDPDIVHMTAFLSLPLRYMDLFEYQYRRNEFVKPASKPASKLAILASKLPSKLASKLALKLASAPAKLRFNIDNLMYRNGPEAAGEFSECSSTLDLFAMRATDRPSNLKTIGQIYSIKYPDGHGNDSASDPIVLAWVEAGKPLAPAMAKDFWKNNVRKFVVYAARNSSTPSASFEYHEQNIWWVLVFITIYGLLHLAAWYFVFPTEAESWLWRSSALSLLAPLFVHPLLIFNCWLVALKFKEVWDYFLYIAMVTHAVVLLPGKIAIMFQVCFSLRLTPPGMYTDVDWWKGFPHI